MTDTFATIKEYLPKFLSPEQKASLFSELDSFPNNIDQRVYSRPLLEERNLFQGDGVSECPVVNLPSTDIAKANCLVLSNTCDIALENRRALPVRLSFCPIIKLSKLEALLNATIGEAKTRDFIRDVRRQRITSMFYLPVGGHLAEEGVALLDQTLNCAFDAAESERLRTGRLFSLSNYGFYLLLFKISIHFTRIMDGVNRDAA